MESAGAEFDKLVAILQRLRAPGDGCPWDREQTFDTIKPYLLEETYEVLDAIDARNWPELRDELGDLMLQPVFFAQMAAEAGHFTIRDSLRAINAKMIRRHPHIFGEGVTADTPDAVKRNWDDIKAAEKRASGAPSAGLLDSVSRAQPALAEARQIAAKAARAGFDWENPDQVLAKLDEELAELAEARRDSDTAQIEGELGDILFVLVNLARFLHIDPEQALRKANSKFRSRFAHVEQGLAARGRTFSESTMEEMESLWQEAKQQSKSGR